MGEDIRDEQHMYDTVEGVHDSSPLCLLIISMIFSSVAALEFTKWLWSVI